VSTRIASSDLLERELRVEQVLGRDEAGLDLVRRADAAFAEAVLRQDREHRLIDRRGRIALDLELAVGDAS